MASLFSDFEELRCFCQRFLDEVDDDDPIAMALESKVREIDSLLSSAVDEMERAEQELEAVSSWHIEYENAVNDWLAWFDGAKQKLNECRIELCDEGNIDDKDIIIQVT